MYCPTEGTFVMLLRSRFDATTTLKILLDGRIREWENELLTVANVDRNFTIIIQAFY